MKHMTDFEIFEAAMDKFGFDEQLRLLQEECAELIVAASHLHRDREGAMKNFIEELVDVNIMCGELQLYLDKQGHGAEVGITHMRKMKRLFDRIKQNPPSEDGGNN